MADFSELPISGGYGDFHFNRFRIAFQVPPNDPSSFVKLQSVLLAVRFPHYINSPFATAQFGDRKHDGFPTFHFHGMAKYLGVDTAFFHSDWVVRKWMDTQSFTVQTLKREFADSREDLQVGLPAAYAGGVVGSLAPVSGILGPVIPVVGGIVGGAMTAIDINRMHFLAGRRAWRVGLGGDFGLSNDVGVLETVAVERFSHVGFAVGDAVMGIEKRVPAIWLAFLNNFINSNALTPATWCRSRGGRSMF
jgi:hypothetical protein